MAVTGRAPTREVNLSNNYFREVWNYRREDYVTLNSMVERFNWDDVINAYVDIDDATKKKTIFKACIPHKIVLFR